MNERIRHTRRCWRVAVLPFLIACVACGGRDEVQPVLSDDGPAAAYLEFAAGDEPDPGQTAYVADGLRLLAGALGDAGIGGLDLGVDLRVTAEHVLLNPASTGTATSVRSALLSAAEALGAGDAGDLQATAESIEPGRGIDEQVDTVHRFFREAAAVLERRFQPR